MEHHTLGMCSLHFALFASSVVLLVMANYFPNQLKKQLHTKREKNDVAPIRGKLMIPMECWLFVFLWSKATK